MKQHQSSSKKFRGMKLPSLKGCAGNDDTVVSQIFSLLSKKSKQRNVPDEPVFHEIVENRPTEAEKCEKVQFTRTWVNSQGKAVNTPHQRKLSTSMTKTGTQLAAIAQKIRHDQTVNKTEKTKCITVSQTEALKAPVKHVKVARGQSQDRKTRKSAPKAAKKADTKPKTKDDKTLAVAPLNSPILAEINAAYEKTKEELRADLVDKVRQNILARTNKHTPINRNTVSLKQMLDNPFVAQVQGNTPLRSLRTFTCADSPFGSVVDTFETFSFRDEASVYTRPKETKDQHISTDDGLSLNSLEDTFYSDETESDSDSDFSLKIVDGKLQTIVEREEGQYICSEIAIRKRDNELATSAQVKSSSFRKSTNEPVWRRVETNEDDEKPKNKVFATTAVKEAYEVIKSPSQFVFKTAKPVQREQDEPWKVPEVDSIARLVAMSSPGLKLDALLGSVETDAKQKLGSRTRYVDSTDQKLCPPRQKRNVSTGNLRPQKAAFPKKTYNLEKFIQAQSSSSSGTESEDDKSADNKSLPPTEQTNTPKKLKAQKIAAQLEKREAAAKRMSEYMAQHRKISSKIQQINKQLSVASSIQSSESTHVETDSNRSGPTMSRRSKAPSRLSGKDEQTVFMKELLEIARIESEEKNGLCDSSIAQERLAVCEKQLEKRNSVLTIDSEESETETREVTEKIEKTKSVIRQTVKSLRQRAASLGKKPAKKDEVSTSNENLLKIATSLLMV
jgi:hypothetical protein